MRLESIFKNDTQNNVWRAGDNWIGIYLFMYDK